MSKIVIIVGSNGNNLSLGNKLGSLLEGLKVNFELIDLVELDLPLYSTTAEKSGIPKKAIELTDKLVSCSGMIVLAPEYNGSIPPVLSNGISWISRGGEDWREAFNNKIVVLGTHSGGGGVKVLEAMRQQFSHLGSIVMGRAILTSYQKEFNEESGKTILSEFIRLCS